MCKGSANRVKNQIKFGFFRGAIYLRPFFRGKDNNFIRDGQKKRPQNDLRPLFYVKNDN